MIRVLVKFTEFSPAMAVHDAIGSKKKSYRGKSMDRTILSWSPKDIGPVTVYLGAVVRW